MKRWRGAPEISGTAAVKEKDRTQIPAEKGELLKILKICVYPVG
jgi:hypothetical protein